MELHKIYYHNIDGFCISLTKKDDLVQILLSNNEIKEVKESSLLIVDSDMIEYIESKEFLSTYDSNTLKKGIDYFKNGRVRSVKYVERYSGLDSTIIDENSSEYRVNMYKVNKSFFSECSCDIGYYCKHSLASLLKVQNILSNLKDYDKRNKKEISINTYNNINIDNDLLNLLIEYNTASQQSYGLIKKILDSLEKLVNQNNIGDYLYHIGKNIKYVSSKQDLYIGLVLKKGINELINTFIEEKSYIDDINLIENTYRIYNNIYDAYSRNLSLPKVRQSVLCLYYNNEYDRALYEFLNLSFDTNHYILSCILDNSGISYDNYPLAVNYIKKYSFSRLSDIYLLISKFTDKQKRNFYSNNKVDFKIPKEDQKYISISKRIEQLIDSNPRITASNSEEILSEIKELSIDEPVGAVNALFTILKKSQYIVKSNRLFEITRKLPNSEYLNLFISNMDSPITSYKKYEYIDYGYEYIDEESFFKYFKYNYFVSIYLNEILVTYTLTINGKEPIIKVEKNKDEYKVITNKLDNNPYSVYPGYLVNYINNKHQDEIKSKEQKLLKEVYDRKNKREKEELLDSLYSIFGYETTSDTSRLVQFNDNKKLNIEYYFEENYNEYLLSLKIGFNKLYIVKSLYHFLESFKDNRYYQYGKELEFVHDKSLLEDTDKEVIDLLQLTVGSYGKTARLDVIQLRKLLLLLKGKTIYYNDIEFKNKLEPTKIDFYIDENYRMVFDLDKDKIIKSIDNELFIFDKNNHEINIVSGDNKEKKLITFFYKNKNKSIEPIKEEFVNNVLIAYPEINIDENIKKELGLNNIVIDSYFDYFNNKITVRYDIFKDENLIHDPIELNRLDKVKLLRYREYLNYLGFNENEMTDDESIFNFFNMDFTELKKYTNVYLSDSITKKEVITFKPGTFRIESSGLMMSVFYEDNTYSDDDLKEIIKGLKRKAKFVLLNNEKIVSIDNEDARDFNETVIDFDLENENLSMKHQIPIAKSLRALAHERNCEYDDYILSMLNEIKSFKQIDIDIPDINTELRDYQKDGFKWLKIISKYNVGGILADDMGLGKTIEIITFIKSDDNLLPSLVVCPKTLIFNWKNEFMRFYKDLKVVVINGNKKERERIIHSIGYDQKIVYVTSYDSIRLDYLSYEGINFNYLIIDEAQYIKNMLAQKSMRIKTLNGAHKFALTGTPIENNILDLFSIFDFIMPGFFEPVDDFKRNYSSSNNFTEVIKKRIAPFILRRKKEDVLNDLPEKFEVVMSAEMTPEQQKLYEAYRKDALDQMAKDVKNKAFSILPYLTRLRQICVDPSMFLDNYNGESGKMELLKETIDERIEKGHRILIFSQFVKALDNVAFILKNRNIKYLMITGDTKGEDRINFVSKFNKNDDYKVFLISLKAGGQGLNLVGADTVIHLDPWWNVAAENQATDRAHRIGQTRNVEVIKMVSSNTIEERVIELQNLKLDLVKNLISDNEKSIENISLDDIKFILN